MRSRRFISGDVALSVLLAMMAAVTCVADLSSQEEVTAVVSGI